MFCSDLITTEYVEKYWSGSCSLCQKLNVDIWWTRQHPEITMKHICKKSRFLSLIPKLIKNWHTDPSYNPKAPLIHRIKNYYLNLYINIYISNSNRLMWDFVDSCIKIKSSQPCFTAKDSKQRLCFEAEASEAQLKMIYCTSMSHKIMESH